MNKNSLHELKKNKHLFCFYAKLKAQKKLISSVFGFRLKQLQLLHVTSITYSQHESFFLWPVNVIEVSNKHMNKPKFQWQRMLLKYSFDIDFKASSKADSLTFESVFLGQNKMFHSYATLGDILNWN